MNFIPLVQGMEKGNAMNKIENRSHETVTLLGTTLANDYPLYIYRCMLSVPKFTANLYCICSSIDLRLT